MIRTSAEHAFGGAVDYDVCIVGAGAAGITLALELGDRGRRVCLLEAGGESYAAAAQRLMDGPVAGGYPPLGSTRMSVLGGSTQVWAGWCRPLDDVDFGPRTSLGWPGWPYDRSALLPYYRRAHEVCGLAEFEYDSEVWRSRLDRSCLIPEGELLNHCIFHVSPLRFGTAHRSRLASAPNVDLLLHVPVTQLDVGGDGAIRGSVVQLRSGRREAVRARDYVLAAGGIENARLLLLSAPEPRGAPGNEYGLVGRFFADHPFVNPGWLVLDGPPRRLDFYFPMWVRDGAGPSVRATLTLPPRVIEEDDLPGSALFFHPRYEAHPSFDAPATRAFLQLWDGMRSRAVPGSAWPLLRRVLRGPHHVAIAAARKLLVRDGPASRWRLRMMFESASRYENRVELCDERDALGRRRTRVHWHIGDSELDGMRRSLARFDEAFRMSGVGRIEPSRPDDRDSWRSALESGKHHIGTTRMHPDPRRGVVDATCRVHGTRNLYVTGSSVFPTAGFANPTLTIVALALRLADHLAGPPTSRPSLEDQRTST